MKRETKNLLAFIGGSLVATAFLAVMAKKQKEEEMSVAPFTLRNIKVDLGTDLGSHTATYRGETEEPKEVEEEPDLVEEEMHTETKTEATAYEPYPHPFPAWPTGESHDEEMTDSQPAEEPEDDGPKIGHPVEEPLIISGDDEEETV